MRRTLLFISASILLVGSIGTAHATDPSEVPPPDPSPGTVDWQLRDAQNIAHSMGRMPDEYANPAFTRTFWTQTPSNYLGAIAHQADDPSRPIVSAGQLLPGGITADPYRDDWESQGRGRRIHFQFLNRYGARLVGDLWEPNPGAPHPLTGAPMNAPYPAIVITTGSIQAPASLYRWAAEGLAESGYLVLTYDVQGQGESEVFGHRPDGTVWCHNGSAATPVRAWEPAEMDPSCPGAPFQQTANFVNGTEDALDFLLSTRDAPYAYYKPGTGTLASDPLAGDVDPSRIGIAGHSLGANAVSIVQAYDARVDTIVAWDNLATYAGAGWVPRVPAMGQNAEYFLNPTPTTSQPAAKDGAFQAWKAAGMDAMQVAIGGATHLEWSYVPFLLPASVDGERVAMYYTLAWFDRYLKGDATATTRLKALLFDTSADTSAIGAGRWDAPTNSNVPYTLDEQRVWSHLSFYYVSEYSLDAGTSSCTDMRRDAAC